MTSQLTSVALFKIFIVTVSSCKINRIVFRYYNHRTTDIHPDEWLCTYLATLEGLIYDAKVKVVWQRFCYSSSYSDTVWWARNVIKDGLLSLDHTVDYIFSGYHCPCKDIYLKKVQFSGNVQYDAFFYCFYIKIKTFSTQGAMVCYHVWQLQWHKNTTIYYSNLHACLTKSNC